MKQRDSSKGLTPRQIRAAAAIADPENAELTLKEIGEKIGVPYNTLVKWRMNEEFLEQTREFARQAMRGHLARVYNALAKEALSGKATALKIFLTHFDGYTERTATDLSGQVATGVTLQFDAGELSPQERAQLQDVTPAALPPPGEGDGE